MHPRTEIERPDRWHLWYAAMRLRLERPVQTTFALTGDNSRPCDGQKARDAIERRDRALSCRKGE